jgi:hypothetical protein
MSRDRAAPASGRCKRINTRQVLKETSGAGLRRAYARHQTGNRIRFISISNIPKQGIRASVVEIRRFCVLSELDPGNNLNEKAGPWMNAVRVDIQKS